MKKDIGNGWYTNGNKYLYNSNKKRSDGRDDYYIVSFTEDKIIVNTTRNSFPKLPIFLQVAVQELVAEITGDGLTRTLVDANR